MESSKLTPKHIECAKILLNCIAQGKYSITYGDIGKLTGLSPYKKDGVPGHIGLLSELCNSLSLPLISVIVINEKTGVCGPGFFKLCNNRLGVHPEFSHSMTSMINACMNDVKQCTRWSELADYLGLEIEGLNVNKKDVQLDINELRIQEINEIESSFEKTPLIGREREAIIKIRENQGIFRKQLLSRYKKCCVCGVNIKDCLIASHIKPWSESEDSEKLDIDNGLLLCPNHDKLFDSGYISFDENGKIMISSELDSSNRQFLNVHDFMKITYSDNIDIYMNYHRNNKFKK